MATLRFTSHLVRHRPAPMITAAGATVAEVLQAGLADDPLLRGHRPDEQGRLRTHVDIDLGGGLIRDGMRLSDAIGPASELHVLQALSGGYRGNALGRRRAGSRWESPRFWPPPSPSCW